MGKVPGLTDEEYIRFRKMAKGQMTDGGKYAEYKALIEKFRAGNGGTTFNKYGPPWSPEADALFEKDFRKPWWRFW